MKEIVDLLRKEKLIYTKLHLIDNKRLQTRKKIAIYEGVDFDRYYTGIFHLVQKSRFLQKDALVLEALYEKLKLLQEHNYKKKILLFDMPFCSKAKALMKEEGWRLIDVAV